MKIALVGYGTMGRQLEEVARRNGMEVVAHFNRSHPLRMDEATRSTLQEVTALIDFSVPDAVLDTIQAAGALSINIVVGTTGWHNRLDEAKKIIELNTIGMVYGSNYLLGVNVFYKIVERAAELLSAAENYDPFLEESHHKYKKDTPSGTALVLQEILAKKFGKREIPITSLRAGYIPGKHVVSFDSTADTVRLEHAARSRVGFAEGAILAAKWIVGRKGFFEFRDVLDSMMGKNNS